MRLKHPDPYNPPVKRGVYKPNANFPGVVRIEIVDSTGDLMMTVECREEIFDESFERAFRRMLERKDTGVKLRVVS